VVYSFLIMGFRYEGPNFSFFLFKNSAGILVIHKRFIGVFFFRVDLNRCIHGEGSKNYSIQEITSSYQVSNMHKRVYKSPAIKSLHNMFLIVLRILLAM
jgi:hypothetical protein